MTIRIRQLLMLVAWAAAYLSLCRTAAWGISLCIGPDCGWAWDAGFVIQIVTGGGLALLASAALCRVLNPMFGEAGLNFTATLGVSLVGGALVLGSMFGTHALLYVKGR